MQAEISTTQTDRERRRALARQTFREFYGLCFWSWPRDWEVTEEDIPAMITELRENGGHAGYRRVAELCR